MLQSWMSIDLNLLLESNIDRPSNAIFMAGLDHTSFSNFDLYFDKEAVSSLPLTEHIIYLDLFSSLMSRINTNWGSPRTQRSSLYLMAVPRRTWSFETFKLPGWTLPILCSSKSTLHLPRSFISAVWGRFCKMMTQNRFHCLWTLQMILKRSSQTGCLL